MPQVQLDHKALKDHKDQLVPRVPLDHKDHKDPRVPRVPLDHKDHKDR